MADDCVLRRGFGAEIEYRVALSFGASILLAVFGLFACDVDYHAEPSDDACRERWVYGQSAVTCAHPRHRLVVQHWGDRTEVACRCAPDPDGGSQ
jgi:hypothetical protein